MGADAVRTFTFTETKLKEMALYKVVSCPSYVTAETLKEVIK